MYINPTRFSGPPEERRSEPENAIYEALAELNIPFDRVDHEYADTMEDCVQIEKLLEGKICKNLFLCNRQQTEFYLLMMPSGKPFKTKYLSAQLGCSRLSFAGESFMEDLLNTIPGSVSALEHALSTGETVRSSARKSSKMRYGFIMVIKNLFFDGYSCRSCRISCRSPLTRSYYTGKRSFCQQESVVPPVVCGIPGGNFAKTRALP